MRTTRIVFAGALQLANIHRFKMLRTHVNLTPGADVLVMSDAMAIWCLYLMKARYLLLLKNSIHAQ